MAAAMAPALARCRDTSSGSTMSSGGMQQEMMNALMEVKCAAPSPIGQDSNDTGSGHVSLISELRLSPEAGSSEKFGRVALGKQLREMRQAGSHRQIEALVSGRGELGRGMTTRSARGGSSSGSRAQVIVDNGGAFESVGSGGTPSHACASSGAAYSASLPKPRHGGAPTVVASVSPNESPLIVHRHHHHHYHHHHMLDGQADFGDHPLQHQESTSAVPASVSRAGSGRGGSCHGRCRGGGDPSPLSGRPEHQHLHYHHHSEEAGPPPRAQRLLEEARLARLQRGSGDKGEDISEPAVGGMPDMRLPRLG